MFKKINNLSKFLLVIAAAALLSGCVSAVSAPQPQSTEKIFSYTNEDQGFSFAFPAEFEYFQTQRKEKNDHVDIEFFVPTTDREYQTEVSGYGKILIVRTFSSADWKKIENDTNQKDGFDKIAASGDKIYTIKFWNYIPKDWQNKWNTELIKKIVNGFTAS
jgi:hypothetical protein